MRIDSSGNLLVGKTANDNTTVGASIRAGESTFTANDSRALTVGRNTNDGDLIQFRKATATVGSIGTVASRLFIGNDDTFLTFQGAADRIYPANSSGGARDAVVDLGLSGGRFKDLYLSGSISLGNSSSLNGTNGSVSIGGSQSNSVEFLTSTGSGQPRIRPSATGTVDLGDTARTFKNLHLSGSVTAPGGFLNGANGGIRIHSGGTKFFNVTAANAARDNIMDIGASDARFKDLYLSGGVQLGGTGSANKLDDYEEGQWTPDLRNSTTSLSTQTWQYGPEAVYTKIGDLVFIHLSGKLSAVGGTGAGELRIFGLPFTSSPTGGYQEYRMNFFLGNQPTAADSYQGFAFVRNNGTDFGTRLLQGGDNIFTSNRLDNDTFFTIFGCYKTNS
jgi:hypothetical protein